MASWVTPQSGEMRRNQQMRLRNETSEAEGAPGQCGILDAR